MDNLEYLEKIKDEEKKWLEINNVVRNLTADNEWDKDAMDYRKTKAFEIIAEQSIHLDNTLAAVVTALENIDTTLNRR